MVELTRTIKRKTRATTFEKGRRRAIIITLEESQKIGVRLEGTRDTYRIDPEALYSFCVKQHEREVEKRAQQIRKTGVAVRTARAQARKELKKTL
jgi:phosphoglucomutase